MVRDSRFELLRIIAMLMIIGSHAAEHIGGGNCITMWTSLSVNQAAATLIGSWGQLGVSLFVLITSWFMVGKPAIKVKKITVLALSTWLGGLVIYFLAVILGYDVPNKVFFQELLTPLYQQYWFLTIYIVFFLILPVLNAAQSALSDVAVKRFAIVFVGIVGAYTFLFQQYDQSLVDFVAIYFLAAAVKRNPDNFISRHVASGAVVSFLLIIVLTLAINLAGTFTGVDSIFELMNRPSGRNLLVYYLAICIFLLFDKMRPIKSRLINKVSTSVFGVYVIHDNIVMRGMNVDGMHPILWDQWLHLDWWYFNSLFFGLYCIGCVVLVFVICSAVTLLWRASVVKLLSKIKRIDRICNRFDAWYSVFDKCVQVHTKADKRQDEI